MDISTCIVEIQTMYAKDETIRKIIKDFDILKKTLLNLDSLIEMYAVKSVIIEHIKMLIVMAYQTILDGKTVDDCYQKHMLHTVFYGNPGVGKSRTARYLAEIWKALGVLKSKGIVEKKITRQEILSRINFIRENFLELYEKNKKDSKYFMKTSFHQWEIIKESLKEFGEEISLTEEITSAKEENLIVICGREDFVAEYSGQTSIKTASFLKKNLGKCIIIEEAYLLYNGENDSYGMEAITVLNRFMEEHSDSIIVIFTGYEDLLHKTIFKAQPGLKRRCQWFFNLQGYSAKGLSQIFESQMKALGWKISSELNCEEFFSSRMDMFSNFGGDTERLALHCKTKSSGDIFKDLHSSITEDKKINKKEIQLEITNDILEKGYQEYVKHRF